MCYLALEIEIIVTIFNSNNKTVLTQQITLDKRASCPIHLFTFKTQIYLYNC